VMWRLTHSPTRWLTCYQRRKPRHFRQTLRDVKAVALLNTFADTLAQAEVKTLATIYVM